MEPIDLEDVVGRALKALPAPRAPRTLLPRVMHAVRAVPVTTPAVNARTWFTWPLALQMASVAALVLVVAGAAWLSTSELAERASAAFHVGQSVWQMFVEPVAGYLLALVIVMCAACVTVGAALRRVALGGALQI